MKQSIYEAAGRHQSFVALARAWHARCLADPIDEQALICFAQALDDAGFPDDSRLRSTLKAYFRWATDTMAAYPKSPRDVPAGLALTRWSWDGPV
jgi:truncated hemoglobin YjbI